MQVLTNDPKAPADLREKSLRLAGRIIEFDPDVRGGQGYSIARDILESGRAAMRMQQIIESQGRAPDAPRPGRLHFDVLASRSGTVIGIDNKHLARIARLAGAPMDKGAGVDIRRKLGDQVNVGDVLYRVHAEFPPDLRFARELCTQNPGYEIGQAEDMTMYSYGL